jgi:hypothetical protein
MIPQAHRYKPALKYVLTMRKRLAVAMLFFYTAVAQLAISASARSGGSPAGSAVAARAVALSALSDEQYRKDFQRLWCAFRLQLQQPAASAPCVVGTRAVERLHADYGVLRALAQSSVYRNAVRVDPFAVALDVLAGRSDVAVSSDRSLLLTAADAAPALCAQAESSDVPADTSNLLAAKIALLYCLGELVEHDREPGRSVADVAPSELALLYPLPVPSGDASAFVIATALGKRATRDGPVTLLLPNNGYVFGGSMHGRPSSLRGLDCSGLVTYCVGSKVRFSTLYLDLLARDLGGLGNALSDSDQATRAELIQTAGFLSSREMFLPVPSDTQLELGDIITWRSRINPVGHSAIFFSYDSSDKSRVMVVGASRRSDGNAGEIRLESSPFKQPHMRTTVLRKRRMPSVD